MKAILLIIMLVGCSVTQETKVNAPLSTIIGVLVCGNLTHFIIVKENKLFKIDVDYSSDAGLAKAQKIMEAFPEDDRVWFPLGNHVTYITKVGC